MRHLCRITSVQSFRHVPIRTLMSTPGVPDSSAPSLSSAERASHSSSSAFSPRFNSSCSMAPAGEEQTEKVPFLSSLTSDLESLQNRWMQYFRVCITSQPTAVIESKPMNGDSWTPVATLATTQLPWGIAKTVENALSFADHREICNITLLDLRERAEDVAVAQELLAKKFPRLQLHIDHSKGTDLQGTVTHSVSVSLRSRHSDEDLSSEEEKSVKEAFLGDSIGASFSSSARRALREAFEAAGIPPPPRRFQGNHQVTSEMEIYLDILRNATNENIDIVASLLQDNNEVQIAVQSSGGRQLHVLTGRRDDALSIALACVERAAENTNIIATQEARKRIADHPIVLALPPRGIRPKEILYRLLFHMFGLETERIRVLTSQSVVSTFVTTVDAEIRWGEKLNNDSPVLSTLARAAGVSKKAAEELACMKAIQRCFPRLFENQLSYHAEVKEIMNSTKATDKDSICPHISKGLLAQLRWAAQCQKKKVLLEAVQLFPNSENESLGIRTTRALWATQLFLVDDKGMRDFVCLALDPKKSASEQKAIAASLWRLFKEECSEGVQYAMDRGLIDKEGNVTSCEGISTSEPLPKNDYELAAESDPFIPNIKLVPSQLVPVLHRQSLLSVFRRGIQLYIELLNEQCSSSSSGNGDGDMDGSHRRQLMECTDRNSVDGSFRAQLLVQIPGDDAINTATITLGEASHPTSAIMALFLAFKSVFEDEEGVIAKAAREDKQVNDIYRDTCQRAEELPPFPCELPMSNPLETTAQCIMLKYGLTTELRISGGGKMIQIQLFGRSPASLCNDHSTSTPQFFLGHGRGNSILKAVVSCCRHVFNDHVRSKDDTSPETGVETVRSGSVQVPLRGKSILALQGGDVMKELLENKAVSSEASIHVKVSIHSLSAETMYEAHLYVVDGKRVVELERTPRVADLLLSLRHLTESINQEMGGPAVDLDATQRQCSGPLRCNTLRQLLEVLYGLPLVVETTLKDNQWQCRLSVHLVEDFYYAVGYSTSTKKKEAMETAAQMALNRFFGSTLPAVKSHAESSTEKQSISFLKENYGFIYRKPLDTTVTTN